MEEINNYDQPNQSYSINLSLPDLRNLAGWATFTAIIDIIVGALSCIGIVTAAYGIPQIIAGVKLLGAADDFKRYMAVNDTQKISESFVKLNKYFKLTGISIIVKIAFGLLFIIAYGAIIAYVVANMPDLFNNFPYDGGY